ncbi:hypothetical protein [Cronobacter sakazakii]|uniref:hypothetical protein n=2 Tax=Cronobacter sakazakii TaxID=28141 RepID=UPI001CECA032|nr:hypothetical protein [Cronobacter sakazakii]MDI7677849.1 hypothetical protein [Cronobacter sakazakii]MDK1264380.1 hypothetical protein [Cronobacter sakazakii]MDK1413147.1 hypothetical protein [Cronobacter sakazakii]MDQ9179493.1 hypothetical protein [Cronobacter sakazakii]MDQ9190356.1 hypothetical protein [Cronobacter sakazakii]
MKSPLLASSTCIPQHRLALFACSLQWMCYRLLLPRVLKFHAFRHADYVINCLILNGIYELFHGEIAMLMTPFLPEISADGEGRKASATGKEDHLRENRKSY